VDPKRTQSEDAGLHRRALLKLAGAASVGGGVAAGVGANPDFAPIGRAEAASQVVESFENTNLSNDYSFDRGASGASLVQSPVYDGQPRSRSAGPTPN